MSERLDDARIKLKNADRNLKISVRVFVVFMVAATGLVSYQLFDLQQGLYKQQQQDSDQAREDRAAAQKRLEQALAENAQQHKQTQAYVKCIANALLTPIADRSDQVFDKCGIETQAQNASSVNPTPAVMPTPSSEPKSPAPNQPTTSSPPDPDQQESPEQPRPSFVDRVLDTLGIGK